MAIEDVRAWLLDTDPALRWQVERDLHDEPEEVWRATRARVVGEGFGARLLSLQDPDGQWAGGAFFPGGWASQPDDAPQPWTATTWSLRSLREWGADPAPLRANGTVEALAANARWEYDDLPYWGGEVDACINATTLANGTWLGADVDGIRAWMVERRMPDGGWNCEWVEGRTSVSSFHSTLGSLRGMVADDAMTGGSAATREARRTGAEYLLRRHLFRRLSTGEPVGPWVDRFSYPSRWCYDVLSALDVLRSAALLDGEAPDPRMAEAVELVRAQRQPDGTWLQAARHPGRVWFEVDVPAGEPSPWLTLMATRVLRWWDSAGDPTGQAAGPR